jgi:hypothetical protein
VQDVAVHRPVPVAGSAPLRTRVTDVWDKGKAAVILQEGAAVSPSGEALWTVRSSVFVRDEGGFGGSRGRSTRVALPERAADAESSYDVLPQQQDRRGAEAAADVGDRGATLQLVDDAVEGGQPGLDHVGPEEALAAHVDVLVLLVPAEAERNMCSIGWPSPRSIASDRAASSSARRGSTCMLAPTPCPVPECLSSAASGPAGPSAHHSRE